VTSPPPAGWYPDPNGTPGQRWWNGASWSDATQAPPLAGPGSQPAPYAPSSSYPSAPGNSRMRRGWAGGNYGGASRNHYAFITFGVSALYIVLALATGFAILGLIPVLMSMRSQRRHEPLAPFAIVAAVVAVIVSISVISGR
jgi:hypothetical protein